MRLLALAAAAAVHLSAPHIAVDLPVGWHGFLFGPSRIGMVREDERARLANFPLPRRDDDVASGGRHKHPLGRHDVLIIVLGYGLRGFFQPLHGPVRIRPRDFVGPVEGFRIGRPFARRTFDVNGRDYDLMVAFGARHAPPALVRQVNRVLATFKLG